MRKSAWLLSAGCLAISVPAHAQQAPATDTDQTSAQATQGATTEGAAVDLRAVERQPTDTADIVVTATRRNQALSDVPLAVSAVTAETLEYSGATDIRQLTQLSPSLLVSSTTSEAGAGVARIRGIGTVGDNPGLESSVAVFIDGVYRSRTGVGLTELGQIDRIEVLRGPQGTLFGRNASAGLISVITAKPRFQPSVYGQVDVGNYDMRRLELGATGPVSDTIAVRLDGVYTKRDGFLTDVISGRDVNTRDRWLLRGQGLFQPSDDLSVRIIADYSKRDEECCGAAFLRARDVTAAGDQPSTIAGIERALGAVINDDTFRRNISITPGRSYRSDVKDGGLSGELVYDFGGAELTSISAYRYNRFVRGQDADYNNLDILFRDDDGTAFNRFKTVSQEVRLQGTTFANRLDWLVGGYFANEKLRVRDNLAFGADYSRLANCLVALSFATATAQPTLVSPTNPTCFNPAVAAAVLPFVGPNATALSAFARLGPFAGAPFTNSGFTNIAIASGAGPLSLNNVREDDLYDQTSRNFALFTHNIFSVTERIKVTIGARYTMENKKLDATLSDNNTICQFFSSAPALRGLQQIPCVIPRVPGGFLALSDRKKENKLSGTAVLSFKPTDELLTYASYSRGYKAGGFNFDRAALPRVAASTAPTALTNGAVLPVSNLDALKFDPEINDAFEIGAKYNGPGFDVNVAAFNQAFDDFQLNLFNGIAFEVENVNSCSRDLGGADTDNSGLTGNCTGKVRSGVRSRGVEVEVFARPIRYLSLNAGMTFVDARYRNNLVGADGEATSAQLFQLPGRRISNSSRLSLTGSVAWTPPIGGSGLKGLVYADARRMSRFNTGSDLDIEKIENGYTVVNGRIGIQGPDQMWAVELWGQNLFNEDYLQVAFDAPLQGSGTTRAVERGFIPRSTQLFGAFLAEPRTFGVTLRGKFGPRPASAPAFAPAPLPPAPPPPAPVYEQPAPPPPPPPPARSGERG